MTAQRPPKAKRVKGHKLTRCRSYIGKSIFGVKAHVAVLRCQCGWRVETRTQQYGRALHREHKLAAAVSDRQQRSGK